MKGLFYERAVKRKVILATTGHPLFDSQPGRFLETLQLPSPQFFPSILGSNSLETSAERPWA
jgi:hypothetical protein